MSWRLSGKKKKKKKKEKNASEFDKANEEGISYDREGNV